MSKPRQPSRKNPPRGIVSRIGCAVQIAIAASLLLVPPALLVLVIRDDMGRALYVVLFGLAALGLLAFLSMGRVRSLGRHVISFLLGACRELEPKGYAKFQQRLRKNKPDSFYIDPDFDIDEPAEDKPDDD